MILFHSTTNLIFGEFRIKGNCGFGCYFAKNKKDSKTFGDLTYKVNLKSVKTLKIHDNEVKNFNFFNISEESFENYIKNGFDSLSWFKNGILKEFVVLDNSIIKSKSLL